MEKSRSWRRNVMIQELDERITNVSVTLLMIRLDRSPISLRRKRTQLADNSLVYFPVSASRKTFLNQ